LFVVLLSLSQFDKPAYRSMIDSLEGAARSAPTVSGRPMATRTTPRPPAPLKEDRRDALVESLRNSVSGAGMSDDVDIRRREGDIEISIRESVLFPSGIADLVTEGEALLSALVPVFANGDYALSVEGHTDAVPIASDRFPSNWELSSARASSVVRFLIGKDIDPKRLTVVGHGDTQPIAPNGTPEGRAQNRRVNFILQVPEN
jgi:chemotaxis protein MotB